MSPPSKQKRLLAGEVWQSPKNAFPRWGEREKSMLPTLRESTIFAFCDISAARMPSPKQFFFFERRRNNAGFRFLRWAGARTKSQLPA